jgi:chromosome segregation ATPase
MNSHAPAIKKEDEKQVNQEEAFFSKSEKRKIQNRMAAKNSRQRRLAEFNNLKSDLRFTREANGRLQAEIAVKDAAIETLKEELAEVKKSLNSNYHLGFFALPDLPEISMSDDLHLDCLFQMT